MAQRMVAVSEIRLDILQEADLTGDAIRQICRRRKISHDSFYRWQKRFDDHGSAGLEPRSTRPHSSPRRISAALEEQICAMRTDNGWGAKRIHGEFRMLGQLPPAVSTIHRVLERNGLVDPQPHKRPKTHRRFERAAPDDLWQIDATQIRLNDGTDVWVIDCLDDHSRYLLAAFACGGATTTNAWSCLEQAFETGAPTEVLSDNGKCFTGRRSLGGHQVEFERRLGELGIKHITTAVRHPQTIGKIERLHRTLKEWLATQPPPNDINELQALLDRFRSHYNHDRPHQGIGNVPPARRYRSIRTLAAPQPIRETVKVDPNGVVHYRYWRFNVGFSYGGVMVDVEQVGDQVRILLDDQILFCSKLLAGVRYYGKRTRR